MRLRIFTEPQQGATYERLLIVAQTAEDLGFDAFFRSDHYLRIGGGSGYPGSTDAWVTLGAIARETDRIRLGTLVTPVTFRLPGQLAIAVAQIDEMSGGRVELGVGLGWYEDEHRAYGIPFPSVAERYEIEREQLEILKGLWTTAPGETFSHDGKHYSVADSPGLPKPLQQPHPPIVMGGFGNERTPRLAAEFADEFNVPFHPLDAFEDKMSAIDRALEAVERHPESIVRSAALTVCCGSDEAEFRRRARNIGQEPEALRGSGAAGMPDEVVERLRAYGEAGASRIYLQVLDLTDLDHLRLLAAEVAPHL